MIISRRGQHLGDHAIMASLEPSGNSRISVPEGHVALVLLQRGSSDFYLEIPIAIINSLCLRPRKYLRFLAWCILGNHGKLVIEPGGDELDNPDGGVEDQDIYYHDMNIGYGAFRSRCHCCHPCMQDIYLHDLLPTKILDMLSTSRLSGLARTTCLLVQILRARTNHFVINC